MSHGLVQQEGRPFFFHDEAASDPKRGFVSIEPVVQMINDILILLLDQG